MTQIAEPVCFGVVSESDIKCPFDHANHKCDASAQNVVSGTSKTLGDNLECAGRGGTVVVRHSEAPFADHVVSTNAEFEAYPEVEPDEQPSWINWVQLIKGNANTWYPVVFQAHHLIPGDGSLKNAAKILKFMDTGAPGSMLCCNLGYDVDGKENGAWLPGKSAVAGGDLGIKLWSSGVATRSLPDKEYASRRAVPRVEKDTGKAETFVPLGGGTPSKSSDAPLDEVFHGRNLKWLYVQAAMKLASPQRQFHDSHSAYYNKVQEHLQNIGAILENFQRPGLQTSCQDCTKPDAKHVPPSKLLGVLNALSKQLRGRVVGSTSDPVYYTSEWCNKAKLTIATLPPSG